MKSLFTVTNIVSYDFQPFLQPFIETFFQLALNTYNKVWVINDGTKTDKRFDCS